MSKRFGQYLGWCLMSLSFFYFSVSCGEKKANQVEKKKITLTVKPKFSISKYEISMQNQGLVNVQNIDSSILVDLKYSSTDNFLNEDVYGILQNAYLQSEPAKALKTASEYLKKTNPNLRLMVYDGARPLEVQRILWEKLDSIPPRKRKDFVADPSEGSIHNYGCAVDLTIFDSTTKQALDMGTKYDHFGYLAYPRLENQMQSEGKLSQTQIDNRELLRKAMKAAGFEPITSEWWHFNYYSRKKAKELYEIVE